MINITKKFRKELFYDRRKYKELVTIRLSNGTRLELTNEHLLEGIGHSISPVMRQELVMWLNRFI